MSDIAELRNELTNCKTIVDKDIAYLKDLARTPEWVKTTGIALVFTVFAQTITAVWWASSMSSAQAEIFTRVDKNTEHRIRWKDTHSETLQTLQRLEINQQNMRDDLMNAMAKQNTHFKEINNIYNQD